MSRRGTPLSPLARELGKREPFDLAEQELFLNIARTASDVSAPVERLFEPHGLSSSTYNILRILRGRGEAMPCSKLGEQLVARVPDTTRLIDRLEKLGLAKRERSPDDRRVVLVRITRAGLDVLAKLDEPLRDLHRKQFAHLTPAQIDKLNALLVQARTPEE
ncbi:MAG: MarR family transcriptional regulator [Planctomycetota bacterium]|nr:MarR family transcriptional regulator [Planctomycetota bacterium]